jgi:hypothetical protein
VASVVWRSIVAAVVALVIAIGVRAFFDGDDGDDFVEVTSDEAAIAPGDAIQRAPADAAIAVRGYVYDDGAFVQLCQGLQDGDPPTCRGPSLLLKNLDLARLALVEDEVDGRTIHYTEEPVTLGGTVLGTELTVLEVLSG